ncbi:PREDICTED: transcription factor bHLH36-like [Camelina sativa]|uniref:Transcription factor bHLH36-like n=1 Tax=Camelina sativa TaxID=90675 RepID=A0ABM0UNF2_CAMSA|nr:PREDICTED: transcription factor bHLH36-like [Camelina sativa]
MDDCRDKRRRRCTKLTCSKDNNNDMEKMMHRETERQRRQEMATLYASLRSLLPLHFIKGKRSTSDQVNEAVNYIKYLQRKTNELSLRRDELMLLSRGSFLGSSNDNCKEEMEMISRKNHVVVRQCLVGVEIVFSSGCRSGQPRFSSVLQVLSENGLYLLNSISSIVDDRLIYTIQAEVNDITLIDLAALENRLIRMK